MTRENESFAGAYSVFLQLFNTIKFIKSARDLICQAILASQAIPLGNADRCFPNPRRRKDLLYCYKVLNAEVASE